MDYPCVTEALDSRAPWFKEALDSLVLNIYNCINYYINYYYYYYYFFLMDYV